MLQLADWMATLLTSLVILVTAPVPTALPVTILPEVAATITPELTLTVTPTESVSPTPPLNAITLAPGLVIEPIVYSTPSALAFNKQPTSQLIPTATIDIQPTSTSVPTIPPTPKPTLKPIPTNTPKPIPTNTPTPSATSLFDLVNNWRLSVGKPIFKESILACQIAEKRVPEVVKSFSHAGFQSMLPSLFDGNPNLHEAAENLANVSTPQAALSGWLASPGHRKNLESTLPHMCIRNSGRYYVQIFTDY